MGSPSEPAKRTRGQIPKVFTLNYAPSPSHWAQYFRLAHEFDCYAAFPEDLSELANQAIKGWDENKTLPDDLITLQACLFYEAKRSRFIEGYPSEEDMGYIDALVNKINSLTDESSGST